MVGLVKAPVIKDKVRDWQVASNTNNDYSVAEEKDWIFQALDIGIYVPHTSINL